MCFFAGCSSARPIDKKFGVCKNDGSLSTLRPWRALSSHLCFARWNWPREFFLLPTTNTSHLVVTLCVGWVGMQKEDVMPALFEVGLTSIRRHMLFFRLCTLAPGLRYSSLSFTELVNNSKLIEELIQSDSQVKETLTQPAPQVSFSFSSSPLSTLVCSWLSHCLFVFVVSAGENENGGRRQFSRRS